LTMSRAESTFFFFLQSTSLESGERLTLAKGQQPHSVSNMSRISAIFFARFLPQEGKFSE